MKRTTPPAWTLSAGLLLLAGFAAPRADDLASLSDPVKATIASEAEQAALRAPPAPQLPLGQARLDPATGRWVASYGDRRAVLTLEPRLQAALERSLEQWTVPWGVTVLIEPATGRVLAMAEHSQREPDRRGMALQPMAPAASIFKLVTAAALLEQGVSPGEQVCYHGGRHRLQPRLLDDDPRRDRSCVTLESAFGHSTNVVFAKLAGRGLDASLLRSAAERFMFNSEIPFAEQVGVSPARIEDDRFELANTAAGFGPVRLSPLHGALLAATVANGGLFVPPVLIDHVEGAPTPTPLAPWRVVDEQVAASLQDMMRATVTEGTGRRQFKRAGGSLRGVTVAGKTGSLSEQGPYRDYSWFVGFAPADKPEIAIATVVVNERLWRVRATRVAREALEAYFRTQVAQAGDEAGPRTAHAARP
ncbi:MAG: penicillin-binding transpeptidase domain-containing protein [Anaeromyxobacter sp.]